MSEPSPAYLWYPKDVLSSGRVAALTPLEELWYRRALDQSWLHVGMPSDPAEFAGWVGRGCTTAGAVKIIDRFFDFRLPKYPEKVFNDKQEILRKEWKRKSKERSKAGIESGRKRRERSKLDAEQMFNKGGTNGNYPFPISFPIPKEDLKRLIHACVRENSTVDPKAVEAGVYYTLLQRNGSTDPIKSLAYFTPQIQKVAADSKGLTANGWKSLLAVRRDQVLKSKAVQA